MYLALEDLSHDPELAQALGNMVVAWANAEITLFSTFSRVANIGLNMAMESYHRIPTFESRVKFTLALVDEWQTADFDKAAIGTTIEKLGKLAKTRNEWVHGDWCALRDKSKTVVFNHRRSPDDPRRTKSVKAHDVRDHCAAVNRRANDLANFIKRDELDP